MIIFTILYLSILVLLCRWLIWAYYTEDSYVTNTSNKKQINVNNTFSIVIALKNESDNLEVLFSSIRNIEYDTNKYEIIFIDDNSNDDTFNKLMEFCQTTNNCVVYQQNKGQNGKKQALIFGISKSKYEYIALTDADCYIHKDWLFSADYKLSNSETDMLIGYSPEYFISHFQFLKQLISATIYASTTLFGLPFSCNGRNLIFNKRCFYEVNGYDDTEKFLVGEDKIILNRFIKAKLNIGYLVYPPIYTKPVELKSLKKQNIRRYGVFKMNLLFWKIIMVLVGISLVMIPIEMYYWKHWLPILAFLLGNYIFIICGCLYHRERFRTEYLLLAPIFPYYIMFLTLYSQTQKGSWK